MVTNGSIGLNCLAYQYCKKYVNKSRLKYLIQVLRHRLLNFYIVARQIIKVCRNLLPLLSVQWVGMVAPR